MRPRESVGADVSHLAHAGNAHLTTCALDVVRAGVAEVVQANEATYAVGRFVANRPTRTGIASLGDRAHQTATQRLTHPGNARLVGGTGRGAAVLLAHSENTRLISRADVSAALGKALPADANLIHCTGDEAACLETRAVNAGLVSCAGSQAARCETLAGNTGLVSRTGGGAAVLETHTQNAALVGRTSGQATRLKTLAGDTGLVGGTGGQTTRLKALAEDTGLVGRAGGQTAQGDALVVDAKLGGQTDAGSARRVLSAHIVHAALIRLADNSTTLRQTLSGGANLAGLADSEAASRLAHVGHAELGGGVTNVDAAQRRAEVVLADFANSTLTRALAISPPEADATVAGFVGITVRLVVARGQACAGAAKLTSQAVGVEQASPLCNAHVVVADLAGATFDIKRARRVRRCLAKVVEADLSDLAETQACAQDRKSVV